MYKKHITVLFRKIKNIHVSRGEYVFAIIAALLTACAIFLTPIRYTALVEPKIREVEPEAIYARMVQNPDSYLFIDVRPAADYKKMHAKGAVNIPIGLFYDKWREFPRTGKEIVLICGGGRLSGVAFFFLQHFGFTNIVRVSGGIENWLSKDLPVVLQETPS